jgi:hypothetical protein
MIGGDGTGVVVTGTVVAGAVEVEVDVDVDVGGDVAVVAGCRVSEAAVATEFDDVLASDEHPRTSCDATITTNHADRCVSFNPIN